MANEQKSSPSTDIGRNSVVDSARNYLGQFLGAVFQRMKPIDVKGKLPILDAEMAIDETAIYKRMRLVPYTPDKLVSRKKIEIYDTMMEDPEIESAINTLKTLRLATGYQIVSASESPVHNEHKEFVEYNLDNIEGSFNDDLREIMGGVEMGISLNEMVYYKIPAGRWAGKIGLRSIKSKNPKYFNIFTDDFDNIRADGIVNISSMDYGAHYPVDKFIVYSFNKRYENIWGTSRIRTLYALWFVKQVIIRSLGIYIEKYGHPFPVMKHPPLDLESKNKLLTVLRQIRTETGLLIPKELELELVSDKGTHSDIHLKAVDYIDKQIRKTILGQTLTAEEGKSGSYSLGQVHYDILMLYVQELGIDISHKAVNEQIIRRLIDYNFSNVDEYPEFEFKPMVERDLEKIIKTYYDGVANGSIKPIAEDENWLREQLGLPKRSELKAPAPAVVATPDTKSQADAQQKAIEQSFVEFQEKVFTGVPRKKFTKYEQCTDFAELKDAHESKVEKYKPRIALLVKDSVKEMIRQIQQKQIIETKNFDAIKSIVFPETGQIKTEFNSMLNDTYSQSMGQARREVIMKKQKAGKFADVTKFQYSIDMRKITPDEAIAYFDTKAFDMAGKIADDIKNQVKIIVTNSIKTGATLRDTVQAIQDKMAPYYDSGAVDPSEITGHRIETIIRTNVNESMNEGRKAFFENPELNDYVVAYEYSAILDDRVRPNHACMDGRVYSVTSPVWDTHTPPNGYNCRCVLIPISADEGFDESEMPPKSCAPDEGFTKPGM